MGYASIASIRNAGAVEVLLYSASATRYQANEAIRLAERLQPRQGYSTFLYNLFLFHSFLMKSAKASWLTRRIYSLMLARSSDGPFPMMMLASLRRQA
jgi:hypothetical protein